MSNTTAEPSVPVLTDASIRRVIISSSIGAILEWFDFFVFASLSGLILGRLFFSATDPVSEVLLGFSTLAVGYFARPIGGIIFGHYGDRLGRKKMLVITIWMMGLSTVVLGMLPTYDVIGVWSTIALVTLRLFQGIAIGGEYGGAALLIVEYAARTRRRGFYSAWANAGASFGFLLSSALLAIITGVLDDEQFAAWGWRIPFLISALLVIVGAYIRSKISDTPAFEAMKKRTAEERGPIVQKVPLFSLFRYHWRPLITAFCVAMSTLVFYQIGLVVVTPYAKGFAGFDTSVVLWAITIAQCVYLVSSISWAAVSDKIGRRPVLLTGALGSGAWIFAFFALINTGEYVALVVAVSGLLVFVGATWGPQAAFLSELFSSDVRYTGLSVGYQTAGALAGLTPILAFSMLSSFDSWLPVAWMSLIGTLLGVVAFTMSRETAKQDLQL